MNNRAVRVVLIAALMIVAAVFFWPPPEPDDPTGEEATSGLSGTGDSSSAFDAAPARDERREWFPDLSDSPSTMTTGDTATGASGRFDCNVEELMREDLDEEEKNARTQLLADTLSRSANAEDQLAAAMIRPSTEVGPRIDNLRRALAADPMHPLVLWQVADDCRRGRGGEYCADPYVRANLETVLGGNGWYWVQVAAFYSEQGMYDQSLVALQTAVSAPEFHDYFIDHLMLLERAFSVDSDRSYIDRVVAAMGYTAAMPAEYLAQHCSYRPLRNSDWLAGCTMLAERYEQDGTNLLMKMIGLGLQEHLYAHSGLVSEVADARMREAELNALIDRVDADYQLVQALDPQINARYLEIWQSSGEVAAFEYAIEAVDQLLEDPDYDPCVYLPSE